MRIIVIEGMPNTGKTTTINLIWNLILSNGGLSTNRQPLGADPNDFSDIVTGYKNLKIAFYSMGDFSTYLKDAIHNYNNQNCDVMICAISTNNPKARANNALNHFGATRIPKTLSTLTNTMSTANNTDTQTIFNLI